MKIYNYIKEQEEFYLPVNSSVWYKGNNYSSHVRSIVKYEYGKEIETIDFYNFKEVYDIKYTPKNPLEYLLMYILYYDFPHSEENYDKHIIKDKTQGMLKYLFDTVKCYEINYRGVVKLS